jgi:hypothetical protein
MRHHCFSKASRSNSALSAFGLLFKIQTAACPVRGPSRPRGIEANEERSNTPQRLVRRRLDHPDDWATDADETPPSRAVIRHLRLPERCAVQPAAPARGRSQYRDDVAHRPFASARFDTEIVAVERLQYTDGQENSEILSSQGICKMVF